MKFWTTKWLRPCGSYAGELCSGFGGHEADFTCWNCGWDRHDHGLADELLLPAYPGTPPAGALCVCEHTVEQHMGNLTVWCSGCAPAVADVTEESCTEFEWDGEDPLRQNLRHLLETINEWGDDLSVPNNIVLGEN